MLDNRIFDKLEFDLISSFKDANARYLKSVATAYLAFTIMDLKEAPEQSLRAVDYCKYINNESIRSFVIEMVDDVDSSVIYNLFKYGQEALKGYILYSEDRYSDFSDVDISTPESVINLALSVLDIKAGEKVLDSCSGVGAFISKAYQHQPYASYYGIEINAKAAALSLMRTSLIGDNITIEQGDIFATKLPEESFDKIFSNSPIGLRSRHLENPSTKSYLDSVDVSVRSASTADWLFNYKALGLKKENGKAVCIMSLGALWNTLERNARSFFMLHGHVDAIVKLPARLFPTFSVPVAMVVLGSFHSGIRFVDASKEYMEGRRQNFLSAENIQHICYAINNDTDISRFVSPNEIASESFTFNPTTYLAEKQEVKGGVPFSTIIKRITRGAAISAEQLDNMVSTVPTNYQYLMLSNIKNGLIEDNLPYLKSLDAEFERYTVKSGNLILSKNGYPFKVAVASVPENTTLLANGNLFVIELDETKVDPFYVKAYLESEQGIAELKRIVVGAQIPNISVRQLETIQIPLIPLEKQKEFVKHYQALMDEVEIYKRKAEKAQNDLKALFPKFFD